MGKNVSQQKQTLAEAAQEIQDLLNQLSQTHPSITTANQQELLNNLKEVAPTYPIKSAADKQTFVERFDEKVRTNFRIREVLLAGGIELIKILCPPLGIPIEMGKRWLETAKVNQ
ncbi:hypothetical protein H6G83_14325 [Anabaena azotica FACHB-119]|uniref:Uncharacterized protein n=1 Tax=Anabaena azotica FACHB-119 TaxID=947527 RepID=A0ABR8D3P1_9NOST|nr:hypothetical protein [Anabaena azotica FACHB-119]